MTKYLIQRLLLVIPTLFLAGTLIFSATRILPGDAAALMLGANQEPFSEEALERLRERLGLADPLPLQFVKFWGATLQGDLGTSIWTKKPVMEEIQRRLPTTLETLALSVTFGWMWGILVGVIAARKPEGWMDQIARSIAILGLSLPIFWVGMMMIVLPAKYFGWTPLRDYKYIWDDPVQNLQLLIFPSLILGMFLGAPVMRLMRTTMLEVLRQDYIRTAYSKGLTERVVLWRHVFKNALMPVITLMGLQVVAGIGGIVVLETLFAIPGMGQLLVAQALPKRDYPLIQGIVLVMATITATVNLCVDLTYGFLDPRVRF
jgi:peptide/nickel transport system permease protein